MFPSPHSGILFLSALRAFYPQNITETVSVPSFGDSFFMYAGLPLPALRACFRPLIRGFFFYSLNGNAYEFYCFKTFPSPHSGILFLSCRYDMPPSLNIFAIFRRILHFLAQKGSPLTQSIHFSPYPSASARIKSFFHPYCTVSNSS